MNTHFQSFIKTIIITCVISAIFTSCATVSYVPYVSLDVSKKTIMKTVEVEKFDDNTSKTEKRNPVFGYAITNPKSLVGSLNSELASGIATDFNNNAVFASAKLKNDSADYRIRGKIVKFYGKVRPPFIVYPVAVLLLSNIAILCGMPVLVAEVDIELELSIYDKKTNKLIGTYHAENRDVIKSNLYNDKSYAINSFMNRTLSKTVFDLREQIIKDEKKF